MAITQNPARRKPNSVPKESNVSTSLFSMEAVSLRLQFLNRAGAETCQDSNSELRKAEGPGMVEAEWSSAQDVFLASSRSLLLSPTSAPTPVLLLVAFPLPSYGHIPDSCTWLHVPRVPVCPSWLLGLLGMWYSDFQEGKKSGTNQKWISSLSQI